MPDAQGREQPGGREQANNEDLLMIILMAVLPMVDLMLFLLLTRLISRMPAWQRDFRKIHWMQERVRKKKGYEYWI